MNRNGGEVHRQSSRQHHAAFDGLYQLGGIAMAGVVSTARVGDAHDRTVKRFVRVTRPLDKGFS